VEAPALFGGSVNSDLLTGADPTVGSVVKPSQSSISVTGVAVLDLKTGTISRSSLE